MYAFVDDLTFLKIAKKEDVKQFKIDKDFEIEAFQITWLSNVRFFAMLGPWLHHFGPE